MRKKMITMVGCCAAVLLTACVQKGNEAFKASETETQITDTMDEAKPESTGNCILSENYQKKALRLGSFTYIALNRMLYKLNDENQIEQSIECEEAVGTFGRGNLYWAMLNAEKKIQIIKIDEQGQISEVGIIEENQPLSFLDFYDDVIYLGFKLGNVVGYRIDSSDKLADPLSADEMEFYKEENQAADIRLHNPNDRDAILAYPYHIVSAGYTKAATGQEFLARHTGAGDISWEEFILRADGKDTVLFSYNEDAIIDRDKIVYLENVDKSKLFTYDLQTGENKKLFELQDGHLELLAFSNNRIYGIWKSIKYLKSFFVYIDLEQVELVSCFETIKGTEYIVINDTVYYIDPVSGNLSFKTL